MKTLISSAREWRRQFIGTEIVVHYLQYQMPYAPMSANRNVDGDPRRVELVDPVSEWSRAVLPGMEALTFGQEIDPQNLPTVMRISGGKRAVTDYDGYVGVTYVSPRFKELIEELEPGVHQFFPMELVDKAKQHIAHHWTWIVCNRLDSVDREHTTMVLSKGRLWTSPRRLSDDELPPGYDRSQMVKTVFNAAQVGDCHFWRDKYLLPGDLYCSDVAAGRIREAGLTGIKLTKAETV